MDELPQQIQEILMRRIGNLELPMPINTVFVLRGLPGSGKSTLADKMFTYCELAGIASTICSADEWFYVHGQYEWRSDSLEKAHLYSQGQFSRALLERHQVIVVDNTNIKEDDFKFYVTHANNQMYNIVFVQWKPVTEGDAVAMAARSSHVGRGYRPWSKFTFEWFHVEGEHEYVRLGCETVNLPFERENRLLQRADGRGYGRRDGMTEVTRLYYRARGHRRVLTFGRRQPEDIFA